MIARYWHLLRLRRHRLHTCERCGNALTPRDPHRLCPECRLVMAIKAQNRRVSQRIDPNGERREEANPNP